MQLSIQDISKTYGNGVKALDHISFNIKAGMFGLLGSNGAGKSSLMRTIATLQFPDSGNIIFDGLDVFEHKIEYRKQLGYLPQSFGVYPKSTAAQLLDYFGLLKGIASKKERTIAAETVLELTNLSEHRNKRVSTFSGGMKQRFGIAQLLLNQPKMIIVDEPTAGLDPAERTRFLNVLRNIGTENIVLFSTHLVEDVRELCQDMAIMERGQLLAQIAPKDAVASLQSKIWEFSAEGNTDTGNNAIDLSSRYDDSNSLIKRVYCDGKPNDHAFQSDAKLEDYYFFILNQQHV